MTYPNTPGYQNNPNSIAMAELLEATGKAEGLRTRVYQEILVNADRGATAEEVSITLDNYTSGVAARFRELELGGAIVRSGETRKNKNGGIDLDVYVATGQVYSPPPKEKKLTRYDTGKRDALLMLKNKLVKEAAANNGWMIWKTTELADMIDTLITKIEEK